MLSSILRIPPTLLARLSIALSSKEAANAAVCWRRNRLERRIHQKVIRPNIARSKMTRRYGHHIFSLDKSLRMHMPSPSKSVHDAGVQVPSFMSDPLAHETHWSTSRPVQDVQLSAQPVHIEVETSQ